MGFVEDVSAIMSNDITVRSYFREIKHSFINKSNPYTYTYQAVYRNSEVDVSIMHQRVGILIFTDTIQYYET